MTFPLFRYGYAQRSRFALKEPFNRRRHYKARKKRSKMSPVAYSACALLLLAVLGEARSFPIGEKRYAVDQRKLLYNILIKGSAVTSKIVMINDNGKPFQRRVIECKYFSFR